MAAWLIITRFWIGFIDTYTVTVIKPVTALLPIYPLHKSLEHAKWLNCQLKVKVTLRLTLSQSVSLGIDPHLRLMTRYLLLFDSYGPVFCWALSLTRGRVCHLYMLLALASLPCKPSHGHAENSLLYCYIIVASTEALPSNALISCYRDVFTAALPSNEHGAGRHGTARWKHRFPYCC
jgi:hypothetical protein